VSSPSIPPNMIPVNDNAFAGLEAIVREIAAEIVGDDTDVDAVLEWAAERFGRAAEDDETAKKLRFALQVIISSCVQDTVVAECADRGLTPPNCELLGELAADIAELTAAPLANRVIRRLTKGGAHAHE
jgi:hypothetical protein